MKWIPFFKTGKQIDSAGRERLWSNAEIDATVEKYNALTDKEKKPIVIGHPTNNLPVLGYINKIMRVNDTLFALPGKVADSFKEIVNNGKFPERSISFNSDGTVNHFGFLPQGISAAVKNLGVYSFEEKEQTTINYSYYDEDIDLIDDEPESNHDLLRIEAELEIINKQIENLTENKDNQKLGNSKLRKEIEIQNNSVVKNEFIQKVNTLSEQGKLAPALKNKFINLFNYINADLSEFEEAKTNYIPNLLSEIIDLIDKRVEFSEVAVKPQASKQKTKLELIAETYKI